MAPLGAKGISLHAADLGSRVSAGMCSSAERSADRER